MHLPFISTPAAIWAIHNSFYPTTNLSKHLPHKYTSTASFLSAYSSDKPCDCDLCFLDHVRDLNYEHWKIMSRLAFEVVYEELM